MANYKTKYIDMYYAYVNHRNSFYVTKPEKNYGEYEPMNKYEFYEKYALRFGELVNIFGARVGRNNCIGYCELLDHPGFITEDDLKIKNCTRKAFGASCEHFIKKPKKTKI